MMASVHKKNEIDVRCPIKRRASSQILNKFSIFGFGTMNKNFNGATWNVFFLMLPFLNLQKQ